MANDGSSAPGRGFGSILRRRWQYLALIVPVPLLIAVYLAFSLPTLFQSTAIIMLEPQFGGTEKVESTVGSSAGRRVEVIQSRVMTQAALEGLIKEYDPYPDQLQMSASRKASEIIQHTSFQHVDPITGAVDGGSAAFALYYENPDPKRAADVAGRIANLFLTYNQRTRAEAATNTAAFLEEQSKVLNKELQEVDAQLAQMKMKYGEALPEAQAQNQFALSGAERELQGLQREIRVQDERESQLMLQLAEISPNMVDIGEDLTNIGKVKARLAEAEQIYTPDHPDVKRLRRAMADLMARNAQGSSQPLKPDNPEYLRVDSQLKAVRRELAALRAQASQENADIQRYSVNLKNTPGVEREISSVMRRREALQAQFYASSEKLRNARLAESFEEESRGEKLTLARAPYPSKLPSSPNRIGMILLGFVIGAALAGIVVAIIEASDPTVRDSSDLPTVEGAALFGSVPVIHTPEDRRRRVLVWGTVASMYALAIAFVGFTVVSAHA